MKRSLAWVLAAGGSALAAPVIFAQVAGPPAGAPMPTPAIVHDQVAGGAPGAAWNPDALRPGMAPAVLEAADLAPRAVKFVTTFDATAGDEESAKLARRMPGCRAKSSQLAVMLRDANDETRRDVEAKLNSTVAAQFDVRQKMRERQLATLEEQLNRLRRVHSDRGVQRDRIINDRVQQLIREAQGLGWGDVGEGDGNKFKLTWHDDAPGPFVYQKLLQEDRKALFEARPEPSATPSPAK